MKLKTKFPVHLTKSLYVFVIYTTSFYITLVQLFKSASSDRDI